jgi:hypothetical protein
MPRRRAVLRVEDRVGPRHRVVGHRLVREDDDLAEVLVGVPAGGDEHPGAGLAEHVLLAVLRVGRVETKCSPIRSIRTGSNNAVAYSSTPATEPSCARAPKAAFGARDATKAALGRSAGPLSTNLDARHQPPWVESLW